VPRTVAAVVDPAPRLVPAVVPPMPKMLAASVAPDTIEAASAVPAVVRIVADDVALAVCDTPLARLLAGPDKAFRPSVTRVFNPASTRVLPNALAAVCSDCIRV
jgi:hypothetical protein